MEFKSRLYSNIEITIISTINKHKRNPHLTFFDRRLTGSKTLLRTLTQSHTNIYVTFAIILTSTVQSVWIQFSNVNSATLA